MKKRKRYLYIFAGIAIILISAIIIIKRNFRFSHVEEKLSQRLEKIVQDATGGLYTLSIGKTNVDIENLSVQLQNLHFTIDSAILKGLPTTKKPVNTFDITLKELSIKNVDALKLITEKSIHLDKIFLNEAIIKMYRTDSSAIKEKDDSATIKISLLYDKIKKDIHSIQIDTLATQNISFTYYGTNKKYKQTDVNRMNAFLFDIRIDSGSKNRNRFLYANEVNVYVDSFSMPVSKNMYKILAEKLFIQIRENTITTVKNFHLQPAYSQQEFSKRLNVQTDRFNIKVPSLIVDNFDYTEFLNNRAMIAAQVILNNADIDVYNDRTLPHNTKSKVGSYPHQLLNKAGFPINVPLIKVRSSKVAYREKNADTKKTGVISFSEVNGEIKNIRNEFEKAIMNVDIDAKFMNSAPVKVHFVFPNNPQNGEFFVSGKFFPFDGKILNPATVPLGEVNIKSANIKLLSFDITVNDTRSNGKILFLYDGIDVEMLKKDTSSKTGFKKRPLLTFLANNFLLKKQNKPVSARGNTISVRYERDVTKSMFNLIWKTIFYGIKEQIGAGGMGKDKERAKVK